jgi:hypothetical protein
LDDGHLECPLNKSLKKVRFEKQSKNGKSDSKRIERVDYREKRERINQTASFGKSNRVTCSAVRTNIDDRSAVHIDRTIKNNEHGIRSGNSNQIDKGIKIGSARNRKTIYDSSFNDKEILELHTNAIPNDDKSKDEIGSGRINRIDRKKIRLDFAGK